MKNYEYTEEEHGTAEEFSIFHACMPASFSLNKKQFQLEENDVILARGNLSFATSGTGAVHTLILKSSFLDQLFDSQTADCRIIHDLLHADITEKPEYLYFSCGEDKDLSMIFSLLEAEAAASDQYNEKMMHLLVIALITMLDRRRPQHLLVTDSTMVSENRFGRIMKYIGDHYSTCTLQEVAEKFGYNPDYLSMRFKKITGQNFTEKLLEMKLDKAEQLLRNTDLPASEIAVQCGFESRSWFIRKFTERNGMTPSKWRKNQQKKI